MKVHTAYFLAVLAVQLQAAPNLGVATVSPTTALIGTPTQITVRVSITDSSLIAGGANLLQLNANGTATVLGTLHDDGLNGDTSAGDLVFTFVGMFNEAVASQVQLQVSAAFKGVLTRVKSPVMNVFFQLPNAPQQSITALAGYLAAGNITSALNFVVPSNKSIATLTALNVVGLNALAAMLNDAVLVSSQTDLRIFQAPFATPSGIATVELSMIPGPNGVWLVNSW